MSTRAAAYRKVQDIQALRTPHVRRARAEGRDPKLDPEVIRLTKLERAAMAKVDATSAAIRAAAQAKIDALSPSERAAYEASLPRPFFIGVRP